MGIEGVVEIESEWTARKREQMGLRGRSSYWNCRPLPALAELGRGTRHPALLKDVHLRNSGSSRDYHRKTDVLRDIAVRRGQILLQIAQGRSVYLWSDLYSDLGVLRAPDSC